MEQIIDYIKSIRPDYQDKFLYDPLNLENGYRILNDKTKIKKMDIYHY